MSFAGREEAGEKAPAAPRVAVVEPGPAVGAADTPRQDHRLEGVLQEEEDHQHTAQREYNPHGNSFANGPRTISSTISGDGGKGNASSHCLRPCRAWTTMRRATGHPLLRWCHHANAHGDKR